MTVRSLGVRLAFIAFFQATASMRTANLPLKIARN